MQKRISSNIFGTKHERILLVKIECLVNFQYIRIHQSIYVIFYTLFMSNTLMDYLIDDSKDLTKILLSRAFEDHLAIGPQRVIA